MQIEREKKKRKKEKAGSYTLILPPPGGSVRDIQRETERVRERQPYRQIIRKKAVWFTPFTFPPEAV